MSQRLRNEERRARRLRRVRATVTGTPERPRLSVKRTLRHVEAQIIDDTVGRTLAAVHDREITEAERKGKKKAELADLVGRMLGARALEKGVKQVVFDRRDKKYHGRVRAVADGARAAGLSF